MKKITTEEFVLLANNIHNFMYEYTRSIYTGSKQKLIITCKLHGDFLQRPEVHLNKSGCPKCWYNRSENLINDFIEKSNFKFENKFDLSNLKVKKNIFYNIKCLKHGNFSSTLEDHLNKNGNCFKCRFKPKKHTVKKIKINKPDYSWNYTELDLFDTKTKKFVSKAISIHQNKYNYLKSNYTHCMSKIHIICKKHGSFLQTPNDHLSGKGCNKCSKIVSKNETKWLDENNILKENRNIKIKVGSEYFIVDGFDPLTNTIYEFNGDFWHGNPKKYKPEDINKVSGKTFGELYKLTIKKEKKLKQHGYNVVSIFESDFKLVVG